MLKKNQFYADKNLTYIAETFCFRRQLLSNVTTDEHGLEIDPQVLHLHPILQYLVRVGQILDPLLNLLLEGHIVAIAHERTQEHERLLEQHHHLADAITLEQELATSFERCEQELLVGPVLSDLFQLGFNVALFHCRYANVLDFFLIKQKQSKKEFNYKFEIFLSSAL